MAEATATIFGINQDLMTREALAALGITIIGPETFANDQKVFLLDQAGLGILTRNGFRHLRTHNTPYDGIFHAEIVREEVPAAPAAAAATPAAPATPAEPLPDLEKIFTDVLATLDHPAFAVPIIPYEGETEATMKPPKVGRIVTWSSSTDGNAAKPAWLAAINAFARQIGMNVSLLVSNGLVSNARQSGFTVHVFSSPTAVGGDGSPVIPPAMYGIKVPSTSKGRFGGSQTGFAILSDEGDEIAAVDPNNLWIYPDICETGKPEELQIFEKIKQAAIMALQTGASVGPAKESYRDRYMEACKVRVNALKRDLEENVRLHEEHIKQYRERLIEDIRQADLIRRQLDGINQSGGKDTERYGSEFDRLCKMDKIERVGFRGNNFWATTHRLFFFDPRDAKKRHEIGKMRIEIDCENGRVRFRNLTRTVTGMREGQQAPHVWADGSSCFGTIENTVAQLLASYEFSSLIQVLIVFLETVNIDGGHHPKQMVDPWPLAKTDEEYAAIDATERAKAVAAFATAQIADPNPTAVPATVAQTNDAPADADGIPAMTYFNADGNEIDAQGHVLV